MPALGFEEKLPALKNAAERQRGREWSPALREALNDITDLAEDERPGLIRAVAGILGELASPAGAGLLAVWLGACVEGGHDPELSCSQIAETFLKWSRTVETIDRGNEDEAEDERPDPEPDAETIAGLQLLGQALVAHLARAPSQRQRFAEAPDIVQEIERIEHLSNGALWVAALLRQRSGELVVLHGTQKAGAIVRYKNLSNCFHLFTLMQGALAGIMPGARQASEDVLDAARGEAQAEVSDSAWWHYGPGTVAEANIGASIWGEASPDSIPSIDGTQVLLLWPPILEHRGWDAGFFGPVLHAALPNTEVTRVLPGAEVDAWRTRLKLPEPQR